METFEEITADLPQFEVVVDGHRDGYRATARFGNRVHVCIDEDMEVATAFASMGLAAIIASGRD